MYLGTPSRRYVSIFIFDINTSSRDLTSEEDQIDSDRKAVRLEISHYADATTVINVTVWSNPLHNYKNKVDYYRECQQREYDSC